MKINATLILRHLYLVCVCFMALASVPLVPRKLDHWFPIPIDGLSWHELLESVFMYILSFLIFSLYYRIITLNPYNNTPSVFVFIPILTSILISMEGNGIHWSCNAIHYTFNPGNEKKNIQRTLYTLTYFLDEIWGHLLMIGGNCLSFMIIFWAEYICFNQMKSKWLHHNMMWFDVLLFYILSFGMGIVLFAGGVEGQTATTVILPFSFIIMIQRIFLKQITHSTHYNIQNFLCYVSFWAALVTLLWGWYFDWTFPEFRVLGLGPFSTWIGKFLNLLRVYNP
eukprot:258915_1